MVEEYHREESCPEVEGFYQEESRPDDQRGTWTDSRGAGPGCPPKHFWWNQQG
jgi:hypothetical protein